MMSVEKLKIELERPEGVFYAGEVVRGHVRLVLSNQMHCRGFQLKMLGRSFVYWHTGGGKNREDHYGKTVFQEQRQTLYGSFFKTGRLDEAGENADFDEVMNLGLVNIPCDDYERDNLQLCVRVMDYDWGKKDDQLGEILLDVAALVRSKNGKETFPLTRFGKSGKGQISLSARWFPYEAIFPDPASGASANTAKKHCLVLRVHQATGLRKADVFGKNDVYVQVYKATNAVPGKALPPPETQIALPPGEMVVPFAFPIGHAAPGSAEFRVEGRGFLRYTLRAYIDLANWKDPSTKRVIRVVGNRPLPMRSLLTEYVSQKLDQPLPSRCCCVKSSDCVTLKLALGRAAYAPGEIVDLVDSRIENKSEEIQTVWLELVNTIVMRVPSGYNTTRYQSFNLMSTEVQPGATLNIADASKHGVQMPSVFPSFDGGIKGKYTRTRYGCLKWSYHIELAVESVSCKIPVLICAAAPYSNVLESARQQKPQTMSSEEDSFSILNEGFHLLGACDTGPMVTGPEDGGKLVNAAELGMLSAYEGREDKYDLEGKEGLKFQPVVNNFARPVRNPLHENHPSTQASSDKLELLLKSMDEGSVDVRRTVGEWVHQFPLHAQDLSGGDFATVLKRVSFSLDQPAVVGELMSALHGTSDKKLSCDDILATMAVCKYQKTEVAKLMAPYCGDTANKQKVLDQLEYDSDRMEVSAAFS